MVDSELETFKRLSLPDYAASLDYTIDRRKSSRGSIVMRHENGDKIVITRQSADGHYTYWSPRDDKDHGTIIDFLSHRSGGNLGQIRKTLRDWSGAPAPARSDMPELQSTPKDRASVQARFASMRVAYRHPYLEDERGIPALTLQYWRFKGRIRIDRHSNAVFGHYDSAGLCGYELKNTNFTGFASGGSKGLWLSKAIPEDNRLVICESAIDALSHAVLFPDGQARYVSIGGKASRTQSDLLRLEIERMAEGSEIVAAMDADLAGRELSEMVRNLVGHAGRNVTFRRHEPEGVKDFNDQLRAGRPKEAVPA
jgi:hypothetical protein